MSNTTQKVTIRGLIHIEKELDYPQFTFSGSNYNFIPSISEFKRELDEGGFKIVKLLTATVRKFDIDEDDNLTPLFSIYPTAQNIIKYSLDGTNYRIEMVKHDVTNAYFRIIAHNTTAGL